MTLHRIRQRTCCPRELSLDGLRCGSIAPMVRLQGGPKRWELGADVISIGVDPYEFNVNKDCGSTCGNA